jgi:hypothetical protein
VNVEALTERLVKTFRALAFCCDQAKELSRHRTNSLNFSKRPY